MLKNQKAFTFIELVVTLAIASVIVAMAVPSFSTMILNNQSGALGEGFATTINFVRSESLRHGKRVSLCSTKDNLACNGTWNDGYMVFEDLAATDKAAAPIVGTVLKVWEKPSEQAEILVKSGSSDLTFLRFTSLGTLARVNADPLNITISVKKCTRDAARRITVGLSGMVSIERVDCI